MNSTSSSTAEPPSSDLGAGVLVVTVGASAPFEPTSPPPLAAPWIPPWAWDAACRYGPTAVRIAVEAAIRYAS
jgi:hypothetical protein